MQETVKAYVAGFLDGDGSIMLQIKPREDCRYGFRLYSTVCLYQDSSQQLELQWIADQLQVGYLSKRNDGMLEYRIDGHERVENFLDAIKQHVRFKKRQVEFMLAALQELKQEQTPGRFLRICQLADKISEANYRSNRKYSAEFVEAEFKACGILPP